ncbi:MAG: alpha/beta hydrolase [Pseudomonadota bacterium]
MDQKLSEITPGVLRSISSNPIPEGAVAGFVETPDGAKIRYANWSSLVSPSKGTVIIVNGRAEFIEKYFETVQNLRESGFGVLTFDWRGQGLSSRLLADPRKGYVDDFDQYLVDFETILDEVALPDCRAPFFVLGHSTGSLVALLAAPRATNRIRRMVLTAPLLALNSLPFSQDNLRRLTGFLKAVGLGELYVRSAKAPMETRPFVGNRLTSDTERFQRNGDLVRAHPDLALGAPTAGWIYASCKAMDMAWDPEFMASVTIPTLLVSAGNDRVVSRDAIEKYGQELRSGAYLTIDGAKHEMMQERDVFRQQLLSAFDAFVPGTEV